MITINDVARRARVAPTTVSHALSGKRHVATATRERILAAARDLDYHPNAAARSLSLRRTSMVALALPLEFYAGALPEGRFQGFIAHTADCLNAYNYKLLCLISRDPEPADLVDLARAGYIDGVLLLQVRLADARVAALQDIGVPFVTIGRSHESSALVSVDADVAAAAAIAVGHLLEAGHRRLAFVTAWRDGMPFYGFQYHALAGFARAHRAHGLPLPERYLLTYDPASGPGDVWRACRDASDEPTAVITTTDLEAMAVLHALAARGQRVPDDLSLVTLGDSTLTTLAQPPITAVRFSAADEARSAVDLLMRLLAGEILPPQEHLVPVDLLERSSTRRIGPPYGHRTAAEPRL